MTDQIYKKQVGGTHYKSMVIQPSEFINRNNIPFAEGNAIKYLCRHKQKHQKEELLKGKYKAGSTIIVSLDEKDGTLNFEAVAAPNEPQVDLVDTES